MTQLTSSTGAVVKDYHYDAFGEEKSLAPGDQNPFRYCGEYYDQETGNYYLRARYYAPGVGRFTQEDPHWNPGNMVYGDDPIGLNRYTMIPSIPAITQSGNLYVYGLGNPIRYVDPTGEITYAIGGEAAAAFLVKLGVSGQLVWDDDGNIGLILAGEGGGGTPAASVSAIFTMTSADTIFDLAEVGFSGGGSAAFGLPVSLGIDVIGGNALDGTPIFGGQLAAGISTPWPEAHGQLSYAGVLSLNWLPGWLKNTILTVGNGIYNSFSVEQKEALTDIVK